MSFCNGYDVKNLNNAPENIFMDKVKNIPEKLEKLYSDDGTVDPKKFVLVRMFGHKEDLENGKLYASPFRPTIHFTLNGTVGGHMYSDWSDSKYAIIIPFYDAVKENKDNFLGGSSVDLSFLGYVKLPKEYQIIERKKGESYDSGKIKRMEKAFE